MNVKRVCGVLVGTLVACLMVMGCSSSGAAPEEGVLDVWATWAGDPAGLQALLSQHTETAGLPVQIQIGVREDQLAKALAGSTPPDVVILTGSGAVASYHQQGLVELLDPWVSDAGIDLDDMYSAALVQCKSPDGALLCLPWVSDVYALLWNKDLFAAAGLDPDRPPNTLEELAQYAEVLTQRDEQGELVQVGFIPDLGRSHTALYARLFGAAEVASAGAALDSQPMVDALQWQRAFYEGYGREEALRFARSLNRSLTSGHPVYAGERTDCAQCHRAAPPRKADMPVQGLYDGRVAMMVSGQWAMMARAEQTSHLGVAPLPAPAGLPERAGATVVQGAVVIVPAGARDKAAAIDLLAWMMTPEVAALAALDRGGLPVSRAASGDLRVQEMPYSEVFLRMLAHPNAGYVDATPLRPELNRALGKVEAQVLHEGGDPAALLRETRVAFASR